MFKSLKEKISSVSAVQAALQSVQQNPNGNPAQGLPNNHNNNLNNSSTLMVGDDVANNNTTNNNSSNPYSSSSHQNFEMTPEELSHLDNLSREEIIQMVEKRTSQCRRYQSKLNDTVVAYKELKAAHEKLERTLEAQQDSLFKRTKELNDSHRQELERQGKLAEALKGRVAERESEIASLRQQLQESADSASSYRSELGRHKSLLSDSESKHEVEVSRLKAEIEELLRLNSSSSLLSSPNDEARSATQSSESKAFKEIHLHEQISALTDTLAQKEKEVAVHVEAFGKLKATLKSKDAQIIELNAQVSAYESQVEQLQASVKKHEASFEASSKEAKTLQNKLSSLQVELTREREAQAAREKLKNSEIEELSSAKVQLEANVSSLMSQIQSSKRDLVKLEASLSEEKAHHQEQVDALKSKIAALEMREQSDTASMSEQEELFQLERSNYEDQINNLNSKLSVQKITYNEKIEILHKEVQDISSLLAAVEQEYSALKVSSKQKLLEAQLSIDTLSQEVEASKRDMSRNIGEHSKLEGLLRDEENKKEALSSENSSLRELLKSSERNTSSLQATLSIIQKSTKEKDEIIADLQNVLSRADTQIKTISSSLTSKESTIEGLKTQLKLSENKFDEQVKKVEKASSDSRLQVLDLQNQISALKSKIESNEKVAKEAQDLLEAKVSLCESVLADKNAEIAQQRGDLALLSEQLASVRGSAQAENKRLEEVNLTLNELGDENQRLQRFIAEITARETILHQENMRTTAELKSVSKEFESYRISSEKELRELQNESSATIANKNETIALHLSNIVDLTMALQSKDDLITLHESNISLQIDQLAALEEEISLTKAELSLKSTKCSELMESTFLMNSKYEEMERKVTEFEAVVEGLNVSLEAERNGKELTQKANTDLQSELQTLTKLYQQTVSELKKTLQREMKVTTSSSLNTSPSTFPHNPMQLVPPPSSPSRPPPLSIDPAPLNSSFSNVSLLTEELSRHVVHVEGREVNFEYLKNIVLKYMLGRTSERKQLLKVIGMLLNFSKGDEDQVKAYLASKSWF